MSNSFGAAADTAMVYVQRREFASVDLHWRPQPHADRRSCSIMSTAGAARSSTATQAIMDTQHAIFNAMVGQGWTLVGISHDGGTTTSCLNTMR
jgi:hypothetical protein